MWLDFILIWIGIAIWLIYWEISEVRIKIYKYITNKLEKDNYSDRI